ncbi:MAG: hypothetical protein QM796_12345 [Chthoniobacteraceae bacterium]
MHNKSWSVLSLIAGASLLLTLAARADTLFVTNLEFTGTLTTAGSSAAAPLKVYPLTKKLMLTILGYPNVDPSLVRVASNSAETEFHLTSPTGSTDYGVIMDILYDGNQTVLTGKSRASCGSIIRPPSLAAAT